MVKWSFFNKSMYRLVKIPWMYFRYLALNQVTEKNGYVLISGFGFNHSNRLEDSIDWGDSSKSVYGLSNHCAILLCRAIELSWSILNWNYAPVVLYSTIQVMGWVMPCMHTLSLSLFGERYREWGGGGGGEFFISDGSEQAYMCFCTFITNPKRD